MEDFYASLKRGKEDKPVLVSMGLLVYDFHDIDGIYFMLDHDLSGCLMLTWSKPMDPSVRGRVTLDGQEVDGVVLKNPPVMRGAWILGVVLRGLVREYDRKYLLHVEGFVDADGNEMEPQDLEVSGPARVLPSPDYAAHDAIALKAAEDGIVLLKNENQALPLAPGVLNLFGRAVHEFRNCAVGAGKINARYAHNLLDALAQSPAYSANEDLCTFYACDEDRIPPADMLAAAREASDTAIMMISRATGENMDVSTARGEYYLSEEEEALVKTLTEVFPHVIAVLNVGYPIDVRFADRYGVDALVYNGFGGMLAGDALLNVLSGKVNPSGKLPDTWALDYFDIPASRNFYDCVDKERLPAESPLYVDTVYEEGIYVGYRYFTSFGKRAAYPFGFGLSYTDFSVEGGDVRLLDDGLHVGVRVKNTGKVSGREVAQVYVGKPDGACEKPERELVWFEKTAMLAPGESAEMEAVIPFAHLTFYDEKRSAYVLEAGSYRVYVGSSALAPLAGDVWVESERIIKQVSPLMQPPFPVSELSRRDAEKTWPKGERSGVVAGKDSHEPYAARKEYPVSMEFPEADRHLTFADVKKDLSLAPALAAAMTVKEMARLAICYADGWGMEGIGEAGRIAPVPGFDFPDFPVSDGNSGVNLRIPNIGLPSGVTLCASFDKELIEVIGRTIGEEAKALSMPMILAPALNIHRNPLNGRQPEYFSEDPYLAGVMSGLYTRGLESAGVASSMKHLCCNNCESSRKRNQSILSERALREIYLRAFEYAMEIQMPSTFMTAYNAVNGRPTAADPDLILGFLREEMGFDGFVMTDWTTYDSVDVAEMAAAGNCWITPGTRDETFTSQLVKGVEEGVIPEARLRENTAYLIRTLARYA